MREQVGTSLLHNPRVIGFGQCWCRCLGLPLWRSQQPAGGFRQCTLPRPDFPSVGPAPMLRAVDFARRDDDVAADGLAVDARAGLATGRAGREPQPVVPAAAAGPDGWRCRHRPMLFGQPSKRLDPAVAGVDVDDAPVGTGGHAPGAAGMLPVPSLNLLPVKGCVLEAVCGNGLFGAGGTGKQRPAHAVVHI